jgi:hypothetical protein
VPPVVEGGSHLKIIRSYVAISVNRVVGGLGRLAHITVSGTLQTDVPIVAVR